MTFNHAYYINVSMNAIEGPIPSLWLSGVENATYDFSYNQVFNSKKSNLF